MICSANCVHCVKNVTPMASLTLRKIPDTELKHLLLEQLDNKLAKNRKLYSLENTLLKIIREHKELKSLKK